MPIGKYSQETIVMRIQFKIKVQIAGSIPKQANVCKMRAKNLQVVTFAAVCRTGPSNLFSNG
jgi:hypothetical protein